MKKKEDIAFYEDQRGERKSSMSGMDEVSVRSVKRRVARRQRDVTTTSTASTASWSGANVSSSGMSANSVAETSSGSDEYRVSPNELSLKRETITLQAPKCLINNFHVD